MQEDKLETLEDFERAYFTKEKVPLIACQLALFEVKLSEALEDVLPGELREKVALTIEDTVKEFLYDLVTKGDSAKLAHQQRMGYVIAGGFVPSPKEEALGNSPVERGAP